MNPEILARLKKLLALSASGNSAEADLALTKAREIAAYHDIDLAVAAVRMEAPEAKEEFTKMEVGAGKRKNVCQKLISWILSKHFNTDVIYSGGRNYGMTIHFIGRKSDVEFAIYLNSFLQQEFMRRWWAYKEAGNHNTRERNSFIYGLYEGLSSKLDEAKAVSEQNKFTFINRENATPENNYDTSFADQVKQKYSLMIVTEKEERKKKVGEFFPTLRSNYDRTRLTGSVDSRGAGRAEGRKINVARPLGSQLALG